MKLFDLSRGEAKELKRIIMWHVGYLALVAVFFCIIYYFGFFKSNRFLREDPLFTYIAPFCTLLFVFISPWRGHWLKAVKDTRERLDNEPAFCLMAALVFCFGFYLYSVFMWAIAAFVPSLFYMGS